MSHWNGFGVLESLPSIAPRPSPILANLTLSSCLLQDLGSKLYIVEVIVHKAERRRSPRRGGGSRQRRRPRVGHGSADLIRYSELGGEDFPMG